MYYVYKLVFQGEDRFYIGQTLYESTFDIADELWITFGGKILDHTRRNSLGVGVHEVVFKGGLRTHIVVDTKTYIKY